jgi:hypothetical protein
MQTAIVSIATREFIDYIKTAVGAIAGNNSTTISTHLFTRIHFDAAPGIIKSAILAQLQQKRRLLLT